MKPNLIIQLLGTLTVGLLHPCFAIAGSLASLADALPGQSFTLTGSRSTDPQEFTLETSITEFASDGARGTTDIYRLRLRCDPAPVGAATGDAFTCLGYTVQLGGGSETNIPALTGFTYLLDLSPTNGHGGRPVLGVPHAPFENLVDANDRPIPPGNAYHVYNAFMDFHAFCSIFVYPMEGGNGIEDLTSIGQKIVHAAAFSEPPVNLGSNVERGSFFKNGEVTLEFKGVGVVDGSVCAILTVDSGRSSFAMTMRPTSNLEIKTVGSSHYKGDIHLDLATQWVSTAVIDETVVSETTLPIPPTKMNAVIERNIVIHNVRPSSPNP